MKIGPLPRRTLLTALAIALVLGAAPVRADVASWTVARVSAGLAGAEGDAWSGTPSVSADGRYVAFSSEASNLVTGDTNNSSDVFVRDLVSGVTTRVSVSSAGAQGTGGSASAHAPSISADGRYVAFDSLASNLVTGDTNGASDVFVRDHLSGTTTRVSVDSDGGQAEGASSAPVISADGQYVAFVSEAPDLVGDDANMRADVFRRGRQSGPTTRVSLSSAGAEGNGDSLNPAISGDGSRIAFDSDATNLVPGDTNATVDVFVRVLDPAGTTRVSVSTGGVQGDGESGFPAISADGMAVAFYSVATNLVAGDTNGLGDVFVHGLDPAETTHVSVSSAGAQGDGLSVASSISGDGRFVVFESQSTNLVPGDTNDVSDVFVRDRDAGQTTRLSVSSAGVQADLESAHPAIASDGCSVAFESDATDLIAGAGDTEGMTDVFVAERVRPASATTLSSKSVTSLAYGTTSSIAGTVTGGGDLAGRRVVLQAGASLATLKDTFVATTTVAGGAFTFTVSPASKTYYRVRFVGTLGSAPSTSTQSLSITPRAWVSAPVAPATMSRTRSYTVYAYLKPRHTVGFSSVRIYKYRLVSGKWKPYSYVTEKAANYGTYSKCSVKLKLTTKGRWRLRAYAPSDSGHAASLYSVYDYVTVK